MATWESRITCNETYVSGGSENYSNVTLTFQIRRLDYNMVGYSNSGSAWWSIDCDGQSSGYQYFTFNWGSTAPGVWWTVGSYSFKIPHNSDGSKTISYSAYYATTISPSSFSASGSSALTKIGRYVNIAIQLAIAGLLSKKVFMDEGFGTLKTNNVMFGVVLVIIVMIFAGLTFLPALALGPISEHLTLWF